MAKNWAIVIGVNNYRFLYDLKYAKTDAEAMHRWLGQSGRFDPQGLFLFTDDSPTIPTKPPIPTDPFFGNLYTFFYEQFEQRQRRLLDNSDNLWFFFSGHGNRGREGDYLMLSDSHPDLLKQTALSVNDITERLRNCGAGNVVMFIDACRNLENRAKGGTITPQDYQGMITFYSCGAEEKSLEVKSIERGAFTHVLLQALEENKKQNRCLTVAELEAYLMKEVPKLSPNQHPLARVEPTYKRNFILFGEAQKKDIESLKNLAIKKAFVEKKKEEARELLLHANKIAKGDDSEIINMLERLSISLPVVNPEILLSLTKRLEAIELKTKQLQQEIEELETKQLQQEINELKRKELQPKEWKNQVEQAYGEWAQAFLYGTLKLIDIVRYRKIGETTKKEEAKKELQHYNSIRVQVTLKILMLERRASVKEIFNKINQDPYPHYPIIQSIEDKKEKEKAAEVFWEIANKDDQIIGYFYRKIQERLTKFCDWITDPNEEFEMPDFEDYKKYVEERIPALKR